MFRGGQKNFRASREIIPPSPPLTKCLVARLCTVMRDLNLFINYFGRIEGMVEWWDNLVLNRLKAYFPMTFWQSKDGRLTTVILLPLSDQ